MFIKSASRLAGAGLGLAAAGYAAAAAYTWLDYGNAHKGVNRGDADPLLDQFMPIYEIVELHQIQVSAPADLTFSAAKEQDLLDSPVIRAIFKTRELVLGSTPNDRVAQTRGLLPMVLSLGWGVLGEIPGREIVLGAVTRPWEANVVFRAVPPADFAAFNEPDNVKIVWNLRVDAISANQSIFRTEARAVATDAVARAKFRRYWAFVSPGVAVIRKMSLKPVKADAERRAHAIRPAPANASVGAAR